MPLVLEGELNQMVEVTVVNAPIEEAKMNTETEDFIELMGKVEQGENDADLERTSSLEAQPHDRDDIIPVKLLSKRAEQDADLESTASFEAQPDDRNDIIPVKLLRKKAEKDVDLERMASSEAQPDDKNDIVPVKLLGKQAEKDACQEGMVSSEAQPNERKYIFPVKLLGKQAEKDERLEGMVALEALPTDKNDMIRTKLPRARRYFDHQDSSLRTCRRCGEDDHIAVDCKVRKKLKVCCICGRLGHLGKHCMKVNKCLFCNKKGHLANDCPEEEIVREQTSSFCLKCANPGHDMFSCTNDYPADDLPRIQCNVCKAFGHLCCVTYGNEGPKSVSCYNCGESDHLGSECKKLPEKISEPKRRKGKNRRKNKKSKVESSRNQLVHSAVGEKRCLEEERDKSEKGKEVPSVPRRCKMRNRVPRFVNSHQNHVSWPNVPYGFSYGPQSYFPRSYGPTFNPPPGFGYAPPVHFGQYNAITPHPQQSWPQWRGGTYPQQRPFIGTHISNVWQLPRATAAEGNNVSFSNSSGQLFSQPQQ